MREFKQQDIYEARSRGPLLHRLLLESKGQGGLGFLGDGGNAGSFWDPQPRGTVETLYLQPGPLL